MLLAKACFLPILPEFRLALVESSVRRQKRRLSPHSRSKPKPSQVGQVGIIFLLTPDRLLIESSELSEAEVCAGFVNHRRGHDELWAQLQAQGLAARDEDYITVPRGRVIFSTQTSQFLLLLDRCILRKPKLVREIRKRLHLPARSLQISTDSHYRCNDCFLENQNEE